MYKESLSVELKRELIDEIKNEIVAFLNAFCLCNYFIKSNIKIEFYKCKVKITTLGGLYRTSLNEFKLITM